MRRVPLLLVLIALLVPSLAVSAQSPQQTGDGPRLMISPDTVSCTVPVVVNGENFTPGSQIAISAGGVDEIPTSVFLSWYGPIDVAADGAFSFELPAGAMIYGCFGGPLGHDGAPYEVTASTYDPTNSEQPFSHPAASATFNFVPSPDDPTLILTPDHGWCDTSIAVTGMNFEPATTVTIFAGPLGGDNFTQVSVTTVADDGDFSVDIPRDSFIITSCEAIPAHIDGVRYLISASTGEGPKQGDNWRAPSAGTVFALTRPTMEHFRNTWARTDKPVADGQVDRTWMWGPQANTEIITEEYVESPAGQRSVQYYDKSRMEVTNPNADPNADWYVTNGLLATELISGTMQLGDSQFEQRSPSRIPVAGDLDSTVTPTYATLEPFLTGETWTESANITQVLDAEGNVTIDPDLVQYGIIAQPTNAPTNHTIASIFWEFLSSEGVVHTDEGEFVREALFTNPWYLTGYPITEAFWTQTKVDGTLKNVLLQCFERRCLTYTPDNPDGWRVEFGNVGQHYFSWRHEGQNSELEGGIVAFFDVDGENFAIWVTNPDTIDDIYALQSGESNANIPIGPIQHGPGVADHNAPWSWHLDPEATEMAEVTIELCDGRPSYVDENVDEYVDVVGSYCPWSAQLVEIEDYR